MLSILFIFLGWVGEKDYSNMELNLKENKMTIWNIYAE